MVLEPAIVAALAAIVLIKQVHVEVQIGEERARLQTTAPRYTVASYLNSMIKGKPLFTLVVITQHS